MNNLIKAADELAEAAEDVDHVNYKNDDLLTALTAYRTARSEQGEVKVKPLVWEGCSTSMTAESSFGEYLVELDGQCGWGFWVPSQDIDYDPKGGFHETLDAAKAAAQADYETRIRSALEE